MISEVNETAYQITHFINSFLMPQASTVGTGREGDPSSSWSTPNQQRSQKLASQVLCNGRTLLRVGRRYARVSVLAGVPRLILLPARLPDAIRCDLERYDMH
jgi:hypothetical protein